MSKARRIGTLDIRILARVSTHGGGYYLYLPKDIAETYGVLAGDRIEVHLGKHFRPKKKEA